MSGLDRLRQIVIAFLVAVILAAFFYVTNAHAADVYIPYPPDSPTSGCALLEPYGWWWFFWGCNK
jgi:hypothetical protein